LDFLINTGFLLALQGIHLSIQMTKKRLSQLLRNTLHLWVFFSLCFAPLLSSVLQNLEVEESVITQEISSTALANSLEHTEPNEIGLNSPLKSFWSFTRQSHRYFTQRKSQGKYSENPTFQNKTFQNKAFQKSFQSTLLTDKHFVLEQPASHLADAKRYLSNAKLQLEGG